MIKPSDVFIVSNSRLFPPVKSDTFAIAIVTQIWPKSKTEENTEYRFTFDVHCNQILFDRSSIDILVLGSIATSLRIESAILSNEYPEFLKDYVTEKIPPKNIGFLKSDSKLLPLLDELNQSQVRAVCNALTMLNPITLLHGPPGTGKTRSLVLLLFGFVEKRMRVVFVAPTNHAAKDCARRFHQLLAQLDQSIISSQQYLLLGNEEQLDLKNDPICSSLYVDNKVRKVLLAANGWLGSWNELMPFVTWVFDGEQKSVLQESDNVWEYYKSTMLNGIEKLVRHCKGLEMIRDCPADFWSKDGTPCEFDLDVDLFERLRELMVTVDKAYSGNPGYFLKLLLTREINETSPLAYYDKRFIDLLDMIAKSCYAIAQLVFRIINMDEYVMKRSLKENAKITFSTVSSSFNNPLFLRRNCVVVVDEAAQVCEAESLIVLQFPNVRSIVLAGDEMQLNSTVMSQSCLRNGYGRSMFERLKTLGIESELLDTQYRMHPKIVDFPNTTFYNGKLKNPDGISEWREAAWHEREYFSALRIIDVPNSQETFDTIRNSFANKMESRLIYATLKRFVKEYPDVKASVGIITFYQAQKATIEEQLLTSGKLNEGQVFFGNLQISVNTVDGFQGQERDIIIISSVRANNNGNIGFLSQKKRLNVALTRARYSLWLLVNEKTLRRDELWKQLFLHAKETFSYKSASNESHMKKEVVASNVLMAVEQTVLISTKFSSDDPWSCILTKKAKNAIEKMTDKQQLLLTERLSLLGQGRLKDRKYVASKPHQIFAMKVDEYFILWRIDLEATKDCYQQVVCIWDIASRSHVAQSVKDIGRVLDSRTEDYLNACAEQGTKSNNTLIYPVSFDKADGKIQFYSERRIAEFVEDGDENITDLVKVYHLNAYMIESIRQGILKSMELPLVLGQEEAELLENSESLFILGRSGTGKTTVMLAKMLVTEETGLAARNVEDVNMSQWLVTCNQKLKENTEKYYLKLRNSVENLQSTPAPSFFVFFDLLVYIDSVLPEKFFLAESDSLLDFEDEIVGQYTFKYFKKSRFVTAQRFFESYYTRIDQTIQKRFSASFLWTQIQTFLKGSFEVLQGNRFLELQEFAKFGDKRDSIMNHDDCELIYSCWRDYERMKVTRHEYDIGDLALNIYQRLVKYPNQIQVDYVYLDEVQDLTQVQIAIFHKICPNEHGFLFAGDTAQTISSGVGFRFEDVRRLHFEHYLDHDSSRVPPIHFLTQNYRTHSGIINFSTTIVDLMFEYFPNSIDKIPAENAALHQGSKPYFLLSHDQEDFQKVIFGQESSRTTDSVVELGADQAIIVRNEKTKERLKKSVSSALILNVYESKGLEFEDVMVFNFFTDSDFSRWRLVIDSSDSYHGFDLKRDHVMSNELKALYVACTRAKGRLWFFEESENADSMVQYWMKHQVLNTSKAETLSLHFAAASSAESWNERGNEFFSLKNYDSALFCFEKAKNFDMAKLCKVKMLISQGEVFKSKGNYKKSRESFIEAAIGLAELKSYVESAQCYFKAEEYHNAVDMFVLASEFISALRICLLKKIPNRALEMLQKHNDIPTETKEKYSRLFSIQEMNNTVSMQKFFNWLPRSSARKFLIRYELFDTLLEYDLKNGGTDQQVAESYWKNGEYYSCFKVFAHGKYYREALLIAFQYYIGPHWISVLFNQVQGKDMESPFNNPKYSKEYGLVIRKIFEFDINWELIGHSFIPYCLIHLSRSGTFFQDQLKTGRKLKDTELYQYLSIPSKGNEFVKKVADEIDPHFMIISDYYSLKKFSKTTDLAELKRFLKQFALFMHRMDRCISNLENQKVSVAELQGFATMFPSEKVSDDYKLFDLAKEEPFYFKGKVSKYAFLRSIITTLKEFKRTVSSPFCELMDYHLNRMTICPAQLPFAFTYCTCNKTMCHSMPESEEIFEYMYALRLEWLQILQQNLSSCKKSFDIQIQYLVQSLFPTHPLKFNMIKVTKYVLRKSINLATSYYIQNNIKTEILDGQVRMLLLSMYTKEPPAIKTTQVPVVILDQAFDWLVQDEIQDLSLFQYGKNLGKFLEVSMRYMQNKTQDYDPRLFCDVMEMWTVWTLVFQKIRSEQAMVQLPASMVSKLIPIEGKQLPKKAKPLQTYQFDDVIMTLLDLLSTEKFKVWADKYQVKNNEYRIVLIRLLKCILTLYMNSPIPKLQKDILAKLKKASKTFQAEKMKPFEPITHIFTINLKKPEAIMEKMKQVFSNTTDQLLKLTGNPSEKAIYVIGDDDVFTLTNYLDFKLEKKGRLSKPRILKLSLDSEEAPPEVIKYQPPPWIIAQLQRFYKTKDRIKTRDRIDMTFKEKLEFHASYIMKKCTKETRRWYQKTMIPFLSLIEKENLKIVGAIGQLKKMKEFTFMGLCWEESLESLHARSEYLESVLERSSPDEFMIAIRSQTEEQVIALLLKLKREYGKDDQITELLNYLNSLK